jgi:hypothetical protein
VEIPFSTPRFHVLLDGEFPYKHNRVEEMDLCDSAQFSAVTGDNVSEPPV